MVKNLDPKWAWEPYSPGEKQPWTKARVGHLYRRLAFGANVAELRQGVATEPQKLITNLLAGRNPSPTYDAATEEYLASNAEKFNQDVQASGWWLYRMLHGPAPATEKLTLFWHNHFATSNTKVQNVGHMVRQYRLMNRNALGKFDVMLQEMSKDPAMMIWLDTVQSKKGMPNENYARELMELFSLGIGNYTEKDIREAARAFTGWELKDGKFAANASQFDDSPKTVMGQTGNFKGEDIVRICTKQPACAKFIVKKMFRFLVSESEDISPALAAPLEKSFADGFDIRKLVETIVRSNLFHSEHAYRTRIKAPVDYVIGMTHALESRMGTINGSLNLATALENLGQNVFHPPSVKGWDGGPTWLNGQTLLFRQNLALDLARRPAGPDKPALALALAEAHHCKSPQDQAALFLDLFLQGDVPVETRNRINEYASTVTKQKTPRFWSKRDIVEQQAVSLCHLVMTLPEYQLD
ncbi:DUF1800 domain-containing protein [Zavarzinella formosa]|uniref:DUF1800 domain-containing protein n=1 Tax=Zavarzinella formosa TaxID=360055 RepID=UPI0002D57414|nr:DUF1800 domain-containing protein [Zavarzinella formosa]